MSVELRGAGKAFGGAWALRGLSLAVAPGELVAVLGPSGCGKTTLLRLLAGLERPDEGQVLHDGAPASARALRARNVGLVFQQVALFEHLTVAANVGFALSVRRRPRREVEARVAELAALLGLAGLEDRRPGDLSGGQRQRVAIARALAASPRLLLLDEPFGALDPRMRLALRRWLREHTDRSGATGLLVTHDQEEAFDVADRVVILNGGRVEQVGTPAQVFEEPASAFVMRFLGAVNVLRGRVDGGRAYVGDLEFAAPAGEARAPAHVFVRPHELELNLAAVPGSLAATVARLVPRGAAVRVELSAPPHGERLEAEVDARRGAALLAALRPGLRVHLSPRRVRVFADPGAAAEPDSLTASEL